MEAVEGKMTELTEQMVACWMSAWRITTLAPKGHRVRWLSRFHCRSLALPRVWYCHSQPDGPFGRAERGQSMAKGDNHNTLESSKSASFVLLAPVTNCKSCKSCTIQGSTTGSYYGTRRDPRSQNCSDSFFGAFFGWYLGARASSPFCDKVSLRLGVRTSCSIQMKRKITAWVMTVVSFSSFCRVTPDIWPPRKSGKVLPLEPGLRRRQKRSPEPSEPEDSWPSSDTHASRCDDTPLGLPGQLSGGKEHIDPLISTSTFHGRIINDGLSLMHCSIIRTATTLTILQWYSKLLTC